MEPSGYLPGYRARACSQPRSASDALGTGRLGPVVLGALLTLTAPGRSLRSRHPDAYMPCEEARA